MMNDILMRELVEDARRGDGEAFGRIYAEYAAELYRFALWYLKNPEDAEDAVQEACIRAFENIAALRRPEAFKSWFFKILANEAKRLSERKTALLRVCVSDEPEGVYHSDFDADITANELLGELSDGDRLLVLLSVLQGFSSKEISEITGIKPSTVRSRLSRSLGLLRRKIENRSDLHEKKQQHK